MNRIEHKLTQITMIQVRTRISINVKFWSEELIFGFHTLEGCVLNHLNSNGCGDLWYIWKQKILMSHASKTHVNVALFWRWDPNEIDHINSWVLFQLKLLYNYLGVKLPQLMRARGTVTSRLSTQLEPAQFVCTLGFRVSQNACVSV
jgi:hypothetical protein